MHHTFSREGQDRRVEGRGSRQVVVVCAVCGVGYRNRETVRSAWSVILIGDHPYDVSSSSKFCCTFVFWFNHPIEYFWRFVFFPPQRTTAVEVRTSPRLVPESASRTCRARRPGLSACSASTTLASVGAAHRRGCWRQHMIQISVFSLYRTSWLGSETRTHGPIQAARRRQRGSRFFFRAVDTPGGGAGCRP